MILHVGAENQITHTHLLYICSHGNMVYKKASQVAVASAANKPRDEPAHGDRFSEYAMVNRSW